MDVLALALTGAAMIMFVFAASGRELRRFNEIALGLVSSPWNHSFPPGADGRAAFPVARRDRDDFRTRKRHEILRGHQTPGPAPCSDVTSASAGSCSPHPGRPHGRSRHRVELPPAMA